MFGSKLTSFILAALLTAPGLAFAGGTWSVITPPAVLEDDTRIGVDSDGNLWLAPQSRWNRRLCGIYKFDGSIWEKFTVEDGLSSDTVLDIEASADGVWILTNEGIDCFDGADWESYNYTLPLGNEYDTYDLAVTEQGTVWCEYRGPIARLKDGEWKQYTENDGLPAREFYANAIASGADNSVCATFTYSLYDQSYVEDGVEKTPEDYGTYIFDGEAWTATTLNYINSQRKPQDAFDTLEFGSDGTFWCSYQWTIWKLNGTVWDPQVSGTQLGVNGLEFDTYGKVWMTSENGVTMYDGETLTEYTEADGLPSGDVIAITAGRNGEVFAVTGNGIAKFTPAVIVENANPSPGFSLQGNFPNPFNGSTVIGYTLPEADFVELSVYNCIGQKIRMLFSGMKSAGRHASMWDGRNDYGETVSTGMYFAELAASGRRLSRRMMYVK